MACCRCRCEREVNGAPIMIAVCLIAAMGMWTPGRNTVSTSGRPWTNASVERCVLTQMQSTSASRRFWSLVAILEAIFLVDSQQASYVRSGKQRGNGWGGTLSTVDVGLGRTLHRGQRHYPLQHGHDLSFVVARLAHMLGETTNARTATRWHFATARTFSSVTGTQRLK